jgi:A/G-specific adenine glycosylase
VGRAESRTSLKPAERSRIARRLLAWYREHKRDLPWRATRDPYAVWVSEVMLQQTQVATVMPYYERWMQRFPTVGALAAAAEHDVLHAWQGLGYYSRARRLRDGARHVVERHGGKLPDSVELLRTLPGIGAYSAGAIASIAFGRREPAVDGNVARVLCRLFALRGDPVRPPLQPELWRIARELVPEREARDFNQALMELGATLCTARAAPRCNECPLERECKAHALGTAAELPELKKRAPPTEVHAVAGVVAREGRLLVVRLPESAPRWAGMWQFPTSEVEQGESARTALKRAIRAQVGLDVEVAELVTVVRHGVTRFKITLDAYQCRIRSGRARPGTVSAHAWKRPSELLELAMPSPQRRIAEHVPRSRWWLPPSRLRSLSRSSGVRGACSSRGGPRGCISPATGSSLAASFDRARRPRGRLSARCARR